MTQNRNKLIALLIGNLANALVHQILEEVLGQEIHRKHYHKESENSFTLAKQYRESLNPLEKPLPEKDQLEIKERIIAKIKNELKLRIDKGYQGIDLNKVEPLVEKALQELKVIT